MKAAFLVFLLGGCLVGCTTTSVRELRFSPSEDSAPVVRREGFRHVTADAPYLQRARLEFREDGSLREYLNAPLQEGSSTQRVIAVEDYGVRKGRCFVTVTLAHGEGEKRTFSVPWALKSGIEILYGSPVDHRGTGPEVVGDRFSAILFDHFRAVRDQLTAELKAAQPARPDNAG